LLEEEYTREKEDPRLQKLTVYHNSLSLQANNILAEVSGEVAVVVNDLSRRDDVGRPFLRSKADETRLNQLNVDRRKLETPGERT